MGKWCMITGCTQGIGKAYVDVLAKQRMNIILVDLPTEKLLRLSQDIESTYKVQTKIIVLDIMKHSADCKKIQDEIKDLDVGVLINNLCVSYPHPEYLLDLHSKSKIYDDIIRCNIMIFTNICRILLTSMVARNKGVIVNVASTFALIPSPLMTVFAASKAYVLKFTKDLSIEYRSRGVIIQCLCPGSIATSSPGSFSEGCVTPSPKIFVESAVKTIGKDNITTGYFPHTLLIGLFRFIYRLSPNLLIDWMMAFMERNRRRALRKIRI